MPSFSGSSSGVPGERRDRERDAWKGIADRVLTVSATVLALSVLFLTRDLELVWTVLLKATWISLGAALVFGFVRLGLDWLWARSLNTESRAQYPWRTWNLGVAILGLTNRSVRAQPIVLMGWSYLMLLLSLTSLIVGIGLLVAFAWLNLNALTSDAM